MESRANILEKLRRKNYSKQTFKEPVNTDVFVKTDTHLIDTFKQEIEKIDGEVSVVENKKEAFNEIISYIKKNNIKSVYSKDFDLNRFLSDNAIKNTDNYNKDIELSITKSEGLIARTGTVLVSSKNAGRIINYYPEHFIVIAKENQIYFNIDEALLNFQNKYENQLPSMISLITGPSRTADIEKTLIIGAHGPKKVKVIILKD